MTASNGPNQFTLSHSLSHRGVLARLGLGAYSRHATEVSLMFFVCPIQAVDPRVRVGRAYRDRPETGAESTLVGEKIRGEARLSVRASPTLSRQNSQFRHSGKETSSSAKMKRKKKQICVNILRRN